MSLRFDFAAEAASGGLAGALGLDVRALVLNALAFLVLAWLLGKFVFPSLTKALDAKQDEFSQAEKLQAQAQKALKDADHKASVILHETRTKADGMVAAAAAEASSIVEAAKAKAVTQAERILAEGHEQLDRDIQVARTELKAEMAALVARATEALIDEKLSVEKDGALIERSLKEAK